MAEENEWHSGTVSFVDKADILDVDGMIKIEVLPAGTIGTGIIQSPTEPINPQEGDLWIDTSG